MADEVPKEAEKAAPKKSNKAKEESAEIPFAGVSPDQIQPTSPIRQRGV